MSNQDHQINLVKEYGREYSLFRTVLLNQIVNYDIPEWFAPLPIVGSYAIYCGKGLVYGYHGKSDLLMIFKKIGEFSQNEKVAREVLYETEELFAWLKPRYDLEIKLTSTQALKEFYDRYRRFFLLQGIVQILPRAEMTPMTIKEHSIKVRERIQEYNEHAEIVFEDALLRIYPTIGRDWKFLLPNEVWGDEVMSTATKDAIKKRKQGFVIFKDQFYAGPSIDGFLERLGVALEDFSDDKIQEFKGQIAQKGVVRGIVKVIDSFESISKVGEGEILVTTMTMPRYITAMKRAAGFVTDEGGLTCHAAIIAREMKKPCIIGTKFATEVLKDGDEIEVDADNGVVKIINKK